MLPDDRIDAIIILMACENSAEIEIENAVVRLLRDTQSSGRQLIVKSKKCREENRQSSGSIEKTAHDFRASLNIIIGFTALMLDEVPGKINEEQRRCLNDILDNSQRLLDLAEDIVKRLEAASEDRK